MYHVYRYMISAKSTTLLLEDPSRFQKSLVAGRAAQKLGQVIRNLVSAARSQDHFPILHSHLGVHDAFCFEACSKHISAQNLCPHVTILKYA